MCFEYLASVRVSLDTVSQRALLGHTSGRLRAESLILSDFCEAWVEEMK